MGKGIRKAVVLLTLLKEEEAREVLSYLTEEEKKQILEGINFLSQEKLDYVHSIISGASYGS